MASKGIGVEWQRLCVRYKLKTKNPRVILERSVSEAKDLVRDVNKKTKNPRVILERSVSEVKDLARSTN